LDNLEPEKTLGDWPMQYQIIRKTSLEDLQNSINDLINADWRPIGGLTIDGANARTRAARRRQRTVWSVVKAT